MITDNIAIKLRRLILKELYDLGKIFGCNRNFISILCYHSFSNSNDKFATSLYEFKKQLGIIKGYAKFVSIEDLEKSKRMLGLKVCLTIDDGYQDVYKIIPLVKKLKIPAALFVLSESAKANRKELDNNHKLLTIPEIKKLHKVGLTIGCHSATHADLSKLNEQDLSKEIIDSKKNLEKKLGFRINYFAYPKGIFNDRILKFVMKAGYKLAFTTGGGSVNLKTNPLLVPRAVVDKSKQLADFPYLICETTFYVRLIIDKLRVWKFLAAIAGIK